MRSDDFCELEAAQLPDAGSVGDDLCELEATQLPDLAAFAAHLIHFVVVHLVVQAAAHTLTCGLSSSVQAVPLDPSVLPESSSTAELRLEALYAGLSWFDVLAAALSNLELGYGELLPAGAARVLGSLPSLRGADLVDLGSGVGKTTLWAAMVLPVRSSTGVEVVEFRHRVAEFAAAAVRGETGAAPLRFVLQDARDFAFASGSHYFWYNTLWSADAVRTVVRRIAAAVQPGATKWLLSQQRLPEPLPSGVELRRVVSEVECLLASETFLLYSVSAGPVTVTSSVSAEPEAT
jgi:hypothetical protein